MILGIGLHGYRKFIKVFILLWLALTILSIPTLAIYDSGSIYDSGHVNFKTWKDTIGNLGFITI